MSSSVVEVDEEKGTRGIVDTTMETTATGRSSSVSSSSDSRSTSTSTIPTDTSRRHDPESLNDDGHPSTTPVPPPPALRKVPSMLPKITPELLREHRSQKQVTEEWSTMPTTRRTSGWRRSDATATAPAATTTTDVSPMEDVGGEPCTAGVGCLSRSSCFCGCWSHGPKVDHSHHQPPPSEPKTICGIPYYLVMILSALLAAVTAGALLTVFYRDHNDDLTMMIDATIAPTSSPSLSNA